MGWKSLLLRSCASITPKILVLNAELEGSITSMVHLALGKVTCLFHVFLGWHAYYVLGTLCTVQPNYEYVISFRDKIHNYFKLYSLIHSSIYKFIQITMLLFLNIHVSNIPIHDYICFTISVPDISIVCRW